MDELIGRWVNVCKREKETDRNKRERERERHVDRALGSGRFALSVYKVCVRHPVRPF